MRVAVMVAVATGVEAKEEATEAVPAVAMGVAV